jgi:hypothetical protein
VYRTKPINTNGEWLIVKAGGIQLPFGFKGLTLHFLYGLGLANRAVLYNVNTAIIMGPINKFVVDKVNPRKPGMDLAALPTTYISVYLLVYFAALSQ